MDVLQGGVVSTSHNPQAGGPPLVGCPRLLIQFIRSYPPYWTPILYPQPEYAPCRGDREPLHMGGTMTPYEFKFYDRTHIITGIACGPHDFFLGGGGERERETEKERKRERERERAKAQLRS